MDTQALDEDLGHFQSALWREFLATQFQLTQLQKDRGEMNIPIFENMNGIEYYLSPVDNTSFCTVNNNGVPYCNFVQLS